MTPILEPAPPRKRMLAYLVDLGVASLAANVVSIVGLVAAVAAEGIAFITPPWGTEFWVLVAVLSLASVVCFHLYFIHFESNQGTTPGKKIFGLRVISVEGKLTRPQCVRRDLYRYWDCMLIYPGLRALGRPDGRRLGDLRAGTQVVHDPRLEVSCLYFGKEDYFRLLDALGSSPSLEREIRDAFLQFASPAFLLGTRPAKEADLSHWDERVRGIWPSLETFESDRKKRLLFFAEFCFQNKVSA